MRGKEGTQRSGVRDRTKAHWLHGGTRTGCADEHFVVLVGVHDRDEVVLQDFPHSQQVNHAACSILVALDRADEVDQAFCSRRTNIHEGNERRDMGGKARAYRCTRRLWRT